MDFQDMLRNHIESGAVLTIAAKPISRSEATGLGIIGADDHGIIKKFYEKPAADLDITDYRIPEKLMRNSLHTEVNKNNEYLASMGIYIFDARIMEEIPSSQRLRRLWQGIIPDVSKHRKVGTFLFDGFLGGNGTIKGFLRHQPRSSLHDPKFQLLQRRDAHLHPSAPPSRYKVNFLQYQQLAHQRGIHHHQRLILSIPSSVCGPLSNRVQALTGVLHGVLPITKRRGESRQHQTEDPQHRNGGGTINRRAIIDQNARIGDGCRIGIDDIQRTEGDFNNYSIHEGIIVIHKKAIIPHGTTL